VYSAVSEIRKLGSFIYEEFMATDGTDVKVVFCSHVQQNSVLMFHLFAFVSDIERAPPH